ncbi:MAG: oligosaccharide flippase family protein [Anaerolinea sp.]|nr:oligosaccharide flippase family protein [Anaerolinea sp.]
MKSLAIRNGLWNGLANAVGVVTGILGSMLVVRSLTPVEYGQFSYYIWLASILGTLGALSLPNAVTKITSELRGEGRAAEARDLAIWVALIIVLVNLVLAGGLVIAARAQPLPQQRYLLMIALVLIPNGLNAVLRSTLWGKQIYRPVTAAIVLALVVQLALTAAAYALNLGVSGYVAAMLLSIVFQAAVLAGFVWLQGRHTRAATRFAPHKLHSGVWRRYAAFAFPLTFVLFFELVVWQRSEIFFLERLSTLEQVGYYNLAFTFFGMFLALGWALVNGYYPALSQDYGARDWRQVQHKVRQGMVFAALFSLPIACGGWATAPQLITLLYGASMEPAIPVARVLLLGLVPGTMAALAGLTVSAVGGVWIHVRIGAVLALINIALDIALIPRYGAVGAAAANTATQALNTILLMIILRQTYNVHLPRKALASLITVGVGATLLIPLAVQHWIPGLAGLAAAVLLSALAYLGAIWKLGYLPLTDFRRATGIIA